MERTFGKTSRAEVSYLLRPGENSLIFLHGLGGSSNNWLRLVKYLDSSYSLYFLDLMGHGRTVNGVWGYTIRDQCRMLGEFIDMLGAERYGLVGNSYGGWIAATFASRYGNPEYLILEDSAGINPTLGEGDRDKMEQFIDRLQSFGRNNDRRVMRNIIVQNSTGEERLGDSDLESIRSHTMVIWGEKDRMIDVSYGRKLNDSIPGSIFEMIQGAGHVPHYTHPEYVAGLINRFASFEPV